MKSIRYSKYTGDDFGLGAEDLLKALSDFFLESGFQNQYYGFSEFNQHTLEDLKKALQQALESSDFFDPEQAQRIQKALEQMSPEEVDQLVNRLVHFSSEQGAGLASKPAPKLNELSQAFFAGIGTIVIGSA